MNLDFYERLIIILPPSSERDAREGHMGKYWQRNGREEDRGTWVMVLPRP